MRHDDAEHGAHWHVHLTTNNASDTRALVTKQNKANVGYIQRSTKYWVKILEYSWKSANSPEWRQRKDDNKWGNTHM